MKRYGASYRKATMETVNEYAFGASFRLYGRDGLNVLFTVRADDAAAHIDLLETHLDLLEAIGYTVNLPGTEPGEQVEEVSAWVLGKTSRGDACVYLYSANEALQWKVATVYVEKMDQLPFATSGNPWLGSAPKRDMAQQEGVLHTTAPFKIVLKPTGEVTDSGRPMTKFDRVLDARPAAPASPQQPAGNGNGKHTNFDDLAPALFPAGASVLVAGKHDEKPGRVVSVGNGDLRLVEVDGREITVSTSRLKPLPGQPKQPALIDAPDNVPGIEYLQD